MVAKPELGLYKPEFHNTDAPYVLPNDITEQGRLHEQHEAAKELMGGSVLHARSENPRLIVDIGCGTGVVSRELAARYPSAQVYGVDLSSMQIHQKRPENLAFIQGDVHRLVGQDARLSPGSIDYIYQRFLVCALTDWPAHMRLVTDMLKKGGDGGGNGGGSGGGGIVEMTEWSWQIYEDGENISHRWPALGEVERYAKKGKGLDLRCSEKIAVWMRDSGLSDVEVVPYRVPVGNWADPVPTKGQRFRDFLSMWQFHKLDMIVDGITLPGDEDYASQLKKRMKKEWDLLVSEPGRKYFQPVVVIGRKP